MFLNHIDYELNGIGGKLQILNLAKVGILEVALAVAKRNVVLTASVRLAGTSWALATTAPSKVPITKSWRYRFVLEMGRLSRALLKRMLISQPGKLRHQRTHLGLPFERQLEVRWAFNAYPHPV